jgi:hypothetical protein
MACIAQELPLDFDNFPPTHRSAHADRGVSFIFWNKDAAAAKHSYALAGIVFDRLA